MSPQVRVRPRRLQNIGLSIAWTLWIAGCAVTVGTYNPLWLYAGTLVAVLLAFATDTRRQR